VDSLRIHAGDDLSERFLREAPRAWRELREQYAPKECVLRQINEVSQENSRKYSEHFKRNGTCALCIAESEDTDSQGEKRIRSEVWGINERYAFYLRRNSFTASWSLNYLAVFSMGGDATEIRRQIDRTIWFRNNDLLFVDPECLPEMVAKPYFQLVSVHPVAEGDELVQIKFRYPHSRDERAPFLNCPLLVEGATVVLDPQRHWSVRSFEITGTDAGGAKYTATCRNTLSDSDPPAFRMAERIHDYPAAKVVAKYTTEIEKVEFRHAPPKSDFTLSAFGLPEPVGTVVRGNSLYLWVAVSGVLLVIFGIAMRRYALSGGG
jgi:hypothetical protein